MATKYFNHSVWRLTPNCHTQRGRILDGELKATTKGFDWENGSKHGVEDGSVHHNIMKFLEQKPGKMATFETLNLFVQPINLDHYLRELVKQGIVT